MVVFNYVFVIRILIAGILGALIGLERKVKHFGLGARTAALICIAACSFTLAGISIFDTSNIARIVQGLATGIGFIGAAIIWRHPEDHQLIIGLTTAAVIWFLTALGILVALGLYLESLIISLIVLIILFLKRVGVE